MFIELNPIVIVDKKELVEGKDYLFEKLPDTSIKFVFKELKSTMIFTPSKIINGIPNLFVDGKQFDFSDYRVVLAQGKPGVSIYFSRGPMGRLDLIPKVMDDAEYKKMKRQKELQEYEKRFGTNF